MTAHETQNKGTPRWFNRMVVGISGIAALAVVTWLIQGAMANATEHVEYDNRIKQNTERFVEIKDDLKEIKDDLKELRRNR